MRKITLTALGSALIALVAVNAASAAERHHARTHHYSTINRNADVRDSYARFGRQDYPAQDYPAYADPTRAWGGTTSAPAGH